MGELKNGSTQMFDTIARLPGIQNTCVANATPTNACHLSPRAQQMSPRACRIPRCR